MESNETSSNSIKISESDKPKSKIVVIPIKIEFEILSEIIFDRKMVQSFFSKEIYNICILFTSPHISKKNKNKFGELFSFIILSKHLDKRTDFYKAKIIYIKNFINHLIIYIRFFLESEEDKQLIDIEKNKNYVDLSISFYKNNEDNSSVIINEITTILPNLIFNKFFNLINLFYQRLEKYVTKKLNNYFYCDTILIKKNTANVFNYLSSCKMFAKLKKVKKLKGIIELTFNMKDIFHGKNGILKLSIINLSCPFCIVAINYIIKTDGNFDHLYYLNIKQVIKFLLKRLRQKISN